MSNRKRFTFFILIALTAGISGVRGASVGVSTTAANQPAPAITQSDPDPSAWMSWDDPTLQESTFEFPTENSSAAAINHNEPTPVAPVPTAFLSGSSVLVGGAILKAIRKLKRG